MYFANYTVSWDSGLLWVINEVYSNNFTLGILLWCTSPKGYITINTVMTTYTIKLKLIYL